MREDGKPVDGFLILPGQEITTAAGHLLALGVRLPDLKGIPPAEAMKLIQSSGGLAVPPHPYDNFRAGIRESILEELPLEAIEGLNGEKPVPPEPPQVRVRGGRALAGQGAQVRTARVAAGLGTIPRVASGGREIYRRKLTFAEAQARIEQVHRPYHDALSRLLAHARNAHGVVFLVDWHSMPSAAADGSGRSGRRVQGCDIVLGDRFGTACAPAISNLAEQTFTAMGYRVARNTPYAGGYTTEHYGRPARRTHALQIEINRALYLDETSRRSTDGFSGLSRDIAAFTARLVAFDWGGLR